MIGLADKLCGQTWHMPPSYALTLFCRAASVTPDILSTVPKCARPEHDIYGAPTSRWELRGNDAIVRVHGPLVKNASPAEKYVLGVTSHEDIADDLRAAENVKPARIVLDMNSPGGTKVGTPELADLVAEVARRVQVVSVNENICCSAAEWLSAAASMRLATPSSTNGSIGVVLEVLDATKLLERIGLRFEQFTSGKYKGMGSPSQSLTDDQKEFLKDFIMNSATEFMQFMQKARGLSLDNMQGQVFDGNEAVRVGLVDGLINSMRDVL